MIVACSAGVLLGRVSVTTLATAILDRHVRRWGMGEGKNEKTRIFPPPPPLLFFQPNTHSLGNLLFSPQASSEIESKMALSQNALARQNKMRSLAKIRLHCRLT